MPEQPTDRPVLLSGRRRAVVRCTVALVLAVLAAPLPGSVTASAEPTPDSGLVAPRTYHVKPPGGRKRPERDKRIHIQYRRGGSEGVGAKTGRLTMDVSGSKETLRLKQFGNGCSSTGGVTVVCEVGASYNSWADWAGALPYAAPGSKAGDRGELHLRYRAPDGHVSTATTTVVVGGPILEVRRPKTIAGVRPSAETGLDLAVRNTGETTADGVALMVEAGSELTLTQRFANCRYTEGDDAPRNAYCTFPDLRLRPGQTVVFSPGLRIRTPRTLDHGSLRQSAWPLDLGPYEDVRVPDGGKPGDGPPLRTQVRSGGSGQWSDEREAWTEVRTDNPADYAAIGAHVRAAPGEKQEVRVGARTDGPGDPGQGGAYDLVFTVPRGAEVLKEPMEEIDEDVFEPSCRHQDNVYTCPLRVHEPGSEETLPFTLRFGKDAGDGAVRLKERKGDEPPEDPDTSDHTAAVTVDLDAAYASSTASGHHVAWGVTGALAAFVVAYGGLLLWRRRQQR
ncbi:hypothetical protein [Streptomyces himalayensis]|uniref:DUF11 domain-containing protein n=1 Tax=Streptomyces himalayensis subsp. himalayensis TaxID=2756131 RepID=A0A7W0DIZ1_9ACTN|nr:hypothetical protein [Streptomyces himalayensis]MBA2945645.1 hypothetical protein [Streptomyces himalayensis subsp. himalayensis]